MADPGEGKVMDEQLEKKHAGWGGEDSLTAELDRKKREQAAERERFEERRRGRDVDGGGAVRLVDDDTSAV